MTLHHKYSLESFSRIILLCLLGLVFQQTVAQPGFNPQARTRAIYINNFIKYIEWPKGAIADTFRIGVVQSPDLTEALTKVARNVSYGPNKIPFKVYEIENLESAKDYSVIYTSIKSKYLPAELFNAVGKDPILLVTEGYDVGSP